MWLKIVLAMIFILPLIVVIFTFFYEFRKIEKEDKRRSWVEYDLREADMNGKFNPFQN